MLMYPKIVLHWNLRVTDLTVTNCSVKQMSRYGKYHQNFYEMGNGYSNLAQHYIARASVSANLCSIVIIALYSA